MAINVVSNQFAQSLYVIAKDKDNIYGIKSLLEQLVNLYRKNPEFRFILLSKRIEKSQKLKILNKSLVGKIDNIGIEIIEILLEKDSIRELPEILRRFQQIVFDKTESSQVSITVSSSIGKQQIIDFQKSLEIKLNKKVDIQLDVDSKIIGGIVLRIDNTIIDGSIKSQLEKIRKHFVLN
tara:strand:+ start:563 stop:1102 length:540 start_codon:yes stop_codon:yes gene_type:complete